VGWCAVLPTPEMYDCTLNDYMGTAIVPGFCCFQAPALGSFMPTDIWRAGVRIEATWGLTISVLIPLQRNTIFHQLPPPATRRIHLQSRLECTEPLFLGLLEAANVRESAAEQHHKARHVAPFKSRSFPAQPSTCSVAPIKGVRLVLWG
jgi:hypothetical protein